MPASRFLVSLILLALSLAACAPAAGPSEVRAASLPTEAPPSAAPACPVTRPPAVAFVPPPPLPPEGTSAGMFWYGSDGLWTELNADGVWTDLPHTEGTGYGQKLVWWRLGYDNQTEQQPELYVTGRRLDGDPNAPAETFVALRATNGYHADYQSFMLTGVDFPSAGCWEVTGEYHGERLSFVVMIEP